MKVSLMRGTNDRSASYEQTGSNAGAIADRAANWRSAQGKPLYKPMEEDPRMLKLLRETLWHIHSCLKREEEAERW